MFSNLKSDEWGSEFGSGAEYDMDECMEGVGETTSTEDSTSSEEDEGWDKEVEEEKNATKAVRTSFSRYRRGCVASLNEEEEKPQEQRQRQRQKEKDEGEKAVRTPFSRLRRGRTYVASLIEEEEKPQQQQQKEKDEGEKITTEPESDFTAEHVLEMSLKKKVKKKAMEIESKSISLDESFGDGIELCEPPELPVRVDQSGFFCFGKCKFPLLLAIIV